VAALADDMKNPVAKNAVAHTAGVRPVRIRMVSPLDVNRVFHSRFAGDRIDIPGTLKAGPEG
jgi:hypothetical protein